MTYTMHHGDALAILSTLDTASVDATITDPPYSSSGSSATANVNRTARNKYVSSDAGHTLPDFPGDQRDQHGYLAWLTLILAETWRITRPGRSLLTFCDWRQLPTVSDALQAAGWSWRGIIPWAKPIARPCKGGFKARCEYILWGVHGSLDVGDDPIYLDGLFTASQPRGDARQHITQKPVELMRELARICPPGGTILDPFTGSGTTGVAALETGRAFIGVELTAHYHHIARQRLADITPALI